MIDTEFEQRGEAFRAFARAPLNVPLSPTQTIKTMEQKTILEWFQLAQEQGYKWAEMAFENTSETNLYETKPTMRAAVNSAFDWSFTDEGWDYWHSVWQSLTVKTQNRNGAKNNS